MPLSFFAEKLFFWIRMLLLVSYGLLFAPIAYGEEKADPWGSLEKKQERIDYIMEFYNQNGWLSRQLEISAYQLMIELQLEGKLDIAKPLYLKKFGSRANALKALAEIADGTGRPDVAKKITEALVEETGKDNSAKGREVFFASHVALARQSRNSGDLVTAERAAIDALKAGSEISGHNIIDVRVLELRSLLSEVAELRGDIATSSDLLMQNIQDALTKKVALEDNNSFPASERRYGRNITYQSCPNELIDARNAAIAFEDRTGILLIDDLLYQKITDCYLHALAEKARDPRNTYLLTTLAYKKKSEAAQNVYRSIAKNNKAEFTRQLEKLYDLSMKNGVPQYISYLSYIDDRLKESGQTEWLAPWMSHIKKDYPYDKLHERFITKKDYQVTDLVDLAHIYSQMNETASGEQIHDLILQWIEVQKNDDDPCVMKEVCDYLAGVAEKEENEERRKMYLDRALVKLTVDYSGANDAGDTMVIQEVMLAQAQAYEAEGRWLSAHDAYIEALNYEKGELIGEEAQKMRHDVYFKDMNTDARIGLAHSYARLNESRKALEITSDMFKSFREHADLTSGDDTNNILQWSKKLKKLLGYHISILAQQREAGNEERYADEALQAAQYLQMSGTAATTQLLLARLKASSKEAETLIRKHQDTELKIAAAYHRLAKYKDEDRRKLIREIETLEQNLEATANEIKEKQPAYFEMARANVLTLDEIRKNMDDEGTVVLLAEGADAFSSESALYEFVITKNNIEWGRVKASSKKLKEDVLALRCGLDYSLWVSSEKDLCELLTGEKFNPRTAAGLPPFDLKRAYRLYQSLLQPYEEIIQKNPIIVVASAGYVQLPFQVLVVKKPDERYDGYDVAEWLGIRNPLSILPSMSTLARVNAHLHSAEKPFISFANPILEGVSDADKAAANKSKQYKNCALSLNSEDASSNTRSFRSPPLMDAVYRDGRIDSNLVRKLSPLPETAREACILAESVDADDDDVWLGDRATEANIDKLSQTGRLSDYKIIHFATHGLVSGGRGKLQRTLPEPAIVLTPPANVDRENSGDGLLMASEVSSLKLNADWVILSACNTGAGGGKGTEALSGLARAFFYAGAKTILVSHWEVYSEAALGILTSVFQELSEDGEISHSEAMRRAMEAIIAKGGYQSHPSYWAPFSVVGDWK